MSGAVDELPPARRLTRRGLATRDRIVSAAATLMHTRGVNATTLDDVRVASGTSKSQLYRHFPDKESLVQAVISRQAEGVLERHRQRLERLNSIRGLELWRDGVVQRNALRNGAYGCELGSLASELADQDEAARLTLNEHFHTWQGLLTSGLARMVEAGALRPDADPDALATGLMAALQGGYLLAQTARDVGPMQIALDMAVAHVKSFATTPEA
ncbi:TetR/AcrR family transcriptional regulator [Blastococcus litoris]|uniref:TetR/AcrR family transcriptional regulator n=1 Tax=Blastococcus litoris TaxID=2171622 RepID=UPI000E308768|nr:TetR/AcrR family transcriptional regulator [Blastococcus litoris]